MMGPEGWKDRKRITIRSLPTEPHYQQEARPQTAPRVNVGTRHGGGRAGEADDAWAVYV